ncbi:YdcF family protein [Desulfogranum mediterraneum]|uniref:YdcF family protein n=1 Tax=Desulfogranum mediterraneum TaxID=160661 RepID=UPI0012948275|nr:YdcF family protein [Desulfogranum mediterraneum]
MNMVFELLVRVLCDARPAETADAAYLYCQTEDSQEEVLQAGSWLVQRGLAARVLILKTGAKSGYPGFGQWSERLEELGVAGGQLEGVDPGGVSALNTLVESVALMRFLRQQGYGSLYVVAPPFHQLRAFMTAVTVALEDAGQLKIFSHPALSRPWGEQVVHSQGVLRAMRRELIHAELERIDTYQGKGDLAGFGSVLGYLDRRDGQGLP